MRIRTMCNLYCQQNWDFDDNYIHVNLIDTCRYKSTHLLTIWRSMASTGYTRIARTRHWWLVSVKLATLWKKKIVA